MKLSTLAEDLEASERIAGIGHNQPEPTPFEKAKEKIDDLYIEATNYLDGDEIKTAEIAAEVEKIETDLKAAIKEADAARTAEYKPLNDKKDEIKSRYDPIIGGSKCDGGTGGDALATCKKALTPWYVEQKRIKDEAAAKALAEAARIQAAALEAVQSASGNLADTRAAGALLKQAAAAVKTAAKTARVATTGTGLKTTFSAEITDLRELSRHVWEQDPDGMREMMLGWASRTVASFGSNAEGMKIPGVNILKSETAR